MDSRSSSDNPHKSTFFQISDLVKHDIKGFWIESEDTITCPDCRSQLIWKGGLRYTDNGKVQRDICRDCDRSFS